MRRAGVLLVIGMIFAAGISLKHADRAHVLLSGSEIGKIDRVFMWKAAARMIRDRPILGHGVNTFMANYMTYWVGGERQPRYAHNCYLQVAAETGLLGLISFLAVLGLFFHTLADGIRRNVEEHVLLFGCAIGLLAFALQAAVDTNFYALRQAALFWVLAGFALGLYHRTSPAASAAAPQPDVARSPEPVVVMGESGG
jgi:O-antigen ligase